MWLFKYLGVVGPDVATLVTSATRDATIGASITHALRNTPFELSLQNVSVLAKTERC
jgi:hypothetical protein